MNNTFLTELINSLRPHGEIYQDKGPGHQFDSLATFIDHSKLFDTFTNYYDRDASGQDVEWLSCAVHVFVLDLQILYLQI